MCVAFPMRIHAVNGDTAQCRAKGLERSVSLLLLQDQAPQPGDYVLVQMGYAVQIVNEEDALKTWALLDQAFSTETQASPDA